jgi:hypothetical protein
LVSGLLENPIRTLDPAGGVSHKVADHRFYGTFHTLVRLMGGRRCGSYLPTMRIRTASVTVSSGWLCLQGWAGCYLQCSEYYFSYSLTSARSLPASGHRQLAGAKRRAGFMVFWGGLMSLAGRRCLFFGKARIASVAAGGGLAETGRRPLPPSPTKPPGLKWKCHLQRAGGDCAADCPALRRWAGRSGAHAAFPSSPRFPPSGPCFRA